MGFINKVKDAVTRGESEEKNESDELGAEFAEELEVEQEAEDSFLEGDDEQEEEIEETWDTPYQFMEDMLEPDGFANGMDFGKKFIFLKTQQSPLYRDRVKHGAETMNMVSQSMQELEEARGKGEETDMGEVADKLSDANRAINAADKLSGKEDMIVAEGMELMRDVVETVGKSATQGGIDAESTVRESDGEL